MNSLVRVRRNVARPGPPTSRGAIFRSFGGSSSGQPTECRHAAVANGSWTLPPVLSATGSGTTRAGRRWRPRRRRSSCGRWQGYVEAVLLELLPDCTGTHARVRHAFPSCGTDGAWRLRRSSPSRSALSTAHRGSLAGTSWAWALPGRGSWLVSSWGDVKCTRALMASGCARDKATGTQTPNYELFVRMVTFWAHARWAMPP